MPAWLRPSAVLTLIPGVNLSQGGKPVQPNGSKTKKVSWSEEAQEYVGLCPDFPSLSWSDKTSVGALRGIRSLVEGATKSADSQKKAGS